MNTMTSIAGVIIFTLFALIVHRGAYGPLASPARSAAREYLEVALLVGCLLVIPYLNLSFALFNGWLGPYFLFCVAAPLVLEIGLHRRSLTAIGLRLPVNRRALLVTGIVLILFVASKLGLPLLTGRGYQFDLRRTITNALIFAFLEEVMFRGMIQTRLQNAMGAVPAWIVSGLFFGLYHLYTHCLAHGAPVRGQLLPVAYVTALGMLLGVIYTKTRSILPSYLIHALNNLAV